MGNKITKLLKKSKIEKNLKNSIYNWELFHEINQTASKMQYSFKLKTDLLRKRKI